MSLADELLADLDDNDDEDFTEVQVKEEPEDVEVKMETEDLDIKEEEVQLTADKRKSVRTVAKLLDSERLKDIVSRMDGFLENPRESDVIYGAVEEDPEYQLIVAANNLTAEIDNESDIINKFCRDNYSKRFPELDSLVPNAWEYIQTVQALKNELTPSKIDEMEFLPPATRMVLSVTAATTQGKELEEDELSCVTEACEMHLELMDVKFKIFQYVESRMSFIAPNTSTIVGASTAAKIMGVAGGLTILSKMPACNVLLLGAQKKTLSGFSTASSTVLPHTGFIYHSDIVQSIPPYLRRKAARQVAGKVTLCARIDACHSKQDGEAGRNFLEEIEKKFDKWQEPAPVKDVKALPRPDDVAKPKRGGRRVRKMKEKFAITEMRRQANRVRFGEINEDIMQVSVGFGLGSLQRDGQSGSIRAPAAVEKKTQVSISKQLKRNLANMSTTVYGGKSTVRSQVSGTSSSVAFTPLQGIEIVNPKAAEKRVAEANGKYFSNESNFFNLAKKKRKEKEKKSSSTNPAPSGGAAPEAQNGS